MEELKTQNLKLKTTAKNLKLYALIISFTLYTLHFTLLLPFIQPSYATDSTPSSDIKSKLEDLKKEIASKAAKLKSQVDQKLKDKAYIGKVKTSSVTSLTLATKTGPKLVTLNQDTVFESTIKTNKTKKKFTQKSIAEEDYLAALGDIDETGVLIAKKVILLPTANSELKTFLWGQILSISDRLVTIKDKDGKSHAASASNTSEIKVGNFVILTGFLNKNEILETDFVHVISQAGYIKPKRAVYPAPNGAGATPSASVKPKNSASPKASSKTQASASPTTKK